MNEMNNKNVYFDRKRKSRVYTFFCLMIYSVANIMYKAIHLFFCKKNKNISKKYNVSICAIFKNEGRYLKEWLEYYKLIGVEHFFLYNNQSDDNYEEILKDYIDSGVVTLIMWPYQAAQIEAYQDCIIQFKELTNWIGFVDIDEFVVPIEDDKIGDFLKKYDSYPSVKIYWKMFGTSGLLNRDKTSFVTEDFIVAWDKLYEVGKCFYNTSYDIDFNDPHNKLMHHCLWGKFKGGISLPPVNSKYDFCLDGLETYSYNKTVIQCNHYFTKSYSEYIEGKMSKSDVFFKDNPHDLDYFYRHELKGVCPDYHIFKYLIKLKLKMLDKEGGAVI